MENFFLKILLFALILISFDCNKEIKRGNVTFGPNGEILGGDGKAYCDKPLKPYAKEIETKVTAEIDSLKAVPQAKLDASLKTSVVRLSDYSSKGLDLDLVLYRICEMSINRGLTNQQTKELIEKSIETWNSSEKKTEKEK